MSQSENVPHRRNTLTWITKTHILTCRILELKIAADWDVRVEMWISILIREFAGYVQSGLNHVFFWSLCHWKSLKTRSRITTGSLFSEWAVAALYLLPCGRFLRFLQQLGDDFNWDYLQSFSLMDFKESGEKKREIQPENSQLVCAPPCLNASYGAFQSFLFFWLWSRSTSSARQHLLPELKILIMPRQESVSAFHPPYSDSLLSGWCRGHKRLLSVQTPCVQTSATARTRFTFVYVCGLMCCWWSFFKFIIAAYARFSKRTLELNS